MLRLLLLALLTSAAFAQVSSLGSLSGTSVTSPIPPIPSTASAFLNQERGSSGNGGPNPDSNPSNWTTDIADAGASSGTCTMRFGVSNPYNSAYPMMVVTITPSASNQFTNCLIYRRLQLSNGAYPANLASFTHHVKHYFWALPTASCTFTNGVEDDGDLWTGSLQLFASYQLLSSTSSPASAFRWWNSSGGDPYGDWTQVAGAGGAATNQTNGAVNQCNQAHEVWTYETVNQSAGKYTFWSYVLDQLAKLFYVNYTFSGYTDTSGAKIGGQFQLDLNNKAVGGNAYTLVVWNYNEWWW